MEIIKKKSGIVKLNSEKPSTAAIGNWGIVDGVHRLSEQKLNGTYVKARLFMGKKKTSKSKIDVPLSKKDSEDTIQAQWDALRSSLKNIFGIFYTLFFILFYFF